MLVLHRPVEIATLSGDIPNMKWSSYSYLFRENRSLVIRGVLWGIAGTIVSICVVVSLIIIVLLVGLNALVIKMVNLLVLELSVVV